MECITYINNSLSHLCLLASKVCNLVPFTNIAKVSKRAGNFSKAPDSVDPSYRGCIKTSDSADTDYDQVCLFTTRVSRRILFSFREYLNSANNSAKNKE